jgi:V/A-type H+-transporting ATPase subunit B
MAEKGYRHMEAAMEQIGINETRGSLIFLQGGDYIAYDEVVRVCVPPAPPRLGRVVRAGRDAAVALVYEGTEGLTLPGTLTQFTGRQLEMRVSRELLGRVFDGLGRPLDGMPPPHGESVGIAGAPMCPTMREYPKTPLSTGFSVIDALATFIRGQKLPIFGVGGLPMKEIAAAIAAGTNADAVVLAAMGIDYDTAHFFRDSFISAGKSTQTVLFLNMAEDPVAARLATPRFALTAAEYLAFSQGMHVLVILIDMTAYCEALREIASSRGEAPGRKGFPGYMYSELASIYERAGVKQNVHGSLTMLPLLTMPAGDITHPIPDLTGYITEGQIVLSEQLHARGVFPPVDPLLSLSRLMSRGKSAEIFSRYAAAAEARQMAQILGVTELSDREKSLLAFAERFEQDFINQPHGQIRTFKQTEILQNSLLDML